MNTTARSRRLGRTELKQKRRTSRKLSHQLSVDNDILVSGNINFSNLQVQIVKYTETSSQQ